MSDISATSLDLSVKAADSEVESTMNAENRSAGNRTKNNPLMNVLQSDPTESGAACLNMILAHFGYWTTLEHVCGIANVQHYGASVSRIVSTGRHFGLEMTTLDLSAEKLKGLEGPIIIFWNFRQFMVLEKFERNLFHLNDPAIGLTTMNPAAFAEGYSGVAIMAKPSPQFETFGSRPSALKFLQRQLLHSQNALLYVGLVSLLMVAPAIIIPGCLRIFVDEYLIAEQRDWIGPLLFMMLLTAVFRGAAGFMQQKTLTALETKLSVSLSSKFLWTILQLPMTIVGQRSSAEIAHRVVSAERIAHLISGEVVSTLFQTLTLPILLAVMAIYDIWIALIGLMTLIINLAVLRFVVLYQRHRTRHLLLEQEKLSAATISTLNAIESIKATGSENDAFHHWAGFQARMINSQQKLRTEGTLLAILPFLLSGLTSVAVLGVGSFQVIGGQLSLGELVALLYLALSIAEPIGKLVGLSDSLLAISGHLARLANMVSVTEPKIITNPSEHSAAFAGKISAQDICFSYSVADQPFLKNITFDLLPGQRLAIVGESGSGKTTLARLLAGIYHPTSGHLLLDDKPYQQYPKQILARAFGHVDQEIYLFEGSVFDNLTMWDETIDESALKQSLEDAQIHHEVALRQGPKQAWILDNGSNCSGGEKQRLEIARALAKDPQILILDEATSAVDAILEKEIESRIRRRGVSMIVISHQLRVVKDADEILVLKNGAIIESGTHEVLAALGGEYCRLMGLAQ